MDPLSITTAILALLGACTTASKALAKIKNLKDAPELIQAINNEMSDLRLILLDAMDFFEHARDSRSARFDITESTFNMCSAIFSHAREKILEVDTILQYQVLKPGR